MRHILLATALRNATTAGRRTPTPLNAAQPPPPPPPAQPECSLQPQRKRAFEWADFRPTTSNTRRHGHAQAIAAIGLLRLCIYTKLLNKRSKTVVVPHPQVARSCDPHSNSSETARFGPHSAKAGPSSAITGPKLANIEQSWPRFDRTESDQCWPGI